MRKIRQTAADQATYNYLKVAQDVMGKASDEKSLRLCGISGPHPPGLIGRVDRDKLATRLATTSWLTAKNFIWSKELKRVTPPHCFAVVLHEEDEAREAGCQRLLELYHALCAVEAIAIDATHPLSSKAKDIVKSAAWPYLQAVREWYYYFSSPDPIKSG